MVYLLRLLIGFYLSNNALPSTNHRQEIDYPINLPPEVEVEYGGEIVDSFEDSTEESIEDFSEEGLVDSIEVPEPYARKLCYATRLYENVPGMDNWCTTNCNWGPSFCPETHCFCDYFANAA